MRKEQVLERRKQWAVLFNLPQWDRQLLLVLLALVEELVLLQECRLKELDLLCLIQACRDLQVLEGLLQE